ncbi:bifunctional DNA-binding transcriptional regulator/O6-methylguanine-DNA methyltransferase Ada [Rhodovulum sulfidophilum]|uniref:bifunctional DNA-binding transcriptional regulator/O6-methylguanine-DNA methyltransferase Ada n=1 Tax=Rhodovulum sulfidophilum TaxID=35806 RepID=UPI001923C62A|nr:bifunctional DNA-binding transcriptional regulator/O6-methylguanine-DNA methyltransferase Ada [Rhodovulum sulfidophilum]MBL3595004.1 bifunctional DNA-binding transcriptional regulator/O6-methylguanine-DNA methyltransferase Ada [Rhodovulum sulfidophilum]MCE8420475.1 bifunctional DNA-binding transcriptional regulator/O6-methylguanine-DNA methyltransferase Ada [Rhodovulum sulfidophilum]
MIETTTEQDARWNSVAARDAGADGNFVYAVKTTGIYCRPSCPSRTAKPQNVRFYETPAEAEAAGFRPCQRCNPNGQSLAEVNATLVAEACRLIEASDEMPKLDELAARIGMSPYYFHRQFKAITGLTPKQWAAAHRSRRVRAELTDQTASVTGAIYGAGFNSNSRFYEQSNKVLGMTPTAYKNGGKDAEIRFAVAQSSLGAILVAQSAKGICAITLGDDPDELVRGLQDLFPKANLIGGDAGFESLVARVVGFVEAPQIGLDLPLDIRGTAFQERVWQALRQIPPGQTASYAEIARRIGEPKAVRAVAQACGANKIAVAIPCHRVVRNDGALSGYRWGVERKKALLEKEAQP